MTTTAMSTDIRVISKQLQEALKRQEALEGLVQQVISGANNALESLGRKVDNLDARLRAQSELIRASVDLHGRENIDARVLVNRDADASAQAEREKAELELFKTQGLAVPAEAVGPKGLVAGVESKPDGTVKHPGYTQAFLENLPEELKTLLIGKKVGDTVTLPNDAGSFLIQQVYDIVPPKAPEAAEAPATEAPTEA